MNIITVFVMSMYPWLTSYLGDIIMSRGWDKKKKYIFLEHASYEWVEVNVFLFFYENDNFYYK